MPRARLRPSLLLLAALAAARLPGASTAIADVLSVPDWLSLLSAHGRAIVTHAHTDAPGLAASGAANGSSVADGAYGAEAAAVAAVRCPAGCTAHGNCDAENGVCDCPLGRGGPACEQARAASTPRRLR